ncbi:hypothetical protein IQ266_04740 [filamentous cyanobacterium LEGE 11480]|uniref:Fluorescence recovery protein n=1 Tax=Romeriopsis navalis LEGE 11480 TaxID=2777977 RepID=A0A928VK11_9CYAN|nr:hypothetical protein [Romeriopsis navalis]MBE9029067.1 hypothetical protein [Romeriopsis navalis LEGE 11480]
MQVTDIEWSETEQAVASAAFDKAYNREIQALVADIRSKVNDLNAVEDLWQLHDLLSIRRHSLDGKYDSRTSALLFVFAQLLQEELLSLDDLAGLSPAKLKKISALTRM